MLDGVLLLAVNNNSNLCLYIYDDSPNILHYKIILIDRTTLLTGSQNLFQHDIIQNYEIYMKFCLASESQISDAIIRQFNLLCSDSRTTKYKPEDTHPISARVLVPYMTLLLLLKITSLSVA